jgi:hypothetical protein
MFALVLQKMKFVSYYKIVNQKKYIYVKISSLKGLGLIFKEVIIKKNKAIILSWVLCKEM